MFSPVTNIEELAGFLAKLNGQPKHHIGYCGVTKKEIMNVLQNDFSDDPLEDSFFLVKEEGEIVGAIGFDIDHDDRSAEVWGPFISKADGWEEIAMKLWMGSEPNRKSLNELHFFVNHQNERVSGFIKSLRARKKGEHKTFKINARQFSGASSEEIEELPTALNQAFIQLHNKVFPETYYTGEDILGRINQYNKVLALKGSHKELIGYVYVEIQPDQNEASLEYVAVTSSKRKFGYGTKLITAALETIFAYPSIKEVSICVNTDLSGAIRLYKRAGFYQIHSLLHYQLSF
ncbi:ribosomal protein S18 acetylase RimI-like enzyme [Bacillus pakistanensis]|uniref:Ribosomal protein S18 acetylase RimI-like enzyme n=1 Tax=Rossellomorea pakistanensis TaxID=992288 RepID=A0ABS2NJ30_9BACI|nr:GNAT family N-acetyltransferase [Bacillus pakistanensis]MBM7587779.1 ribosomal protein S18 acetylase RimI-like enzyme [Bacillus pakistanensis]